MVSQAKESSQITEAALGSSCCPGDRRLNILGPREYNAGLGITKKGLQEDAVANCIFRLGPYLVAVPLLAENRRKPAEERWEINPDGSVGLRSFV